jgi:hypothetical protein
MMADLYDFNYKLIVEYAYQNPVAAYPIAPAVSGAFKFLAASDEPGIFAALKVLAYPQQ